MVHLTARVLLVLLLLPALAFGQARGEFRIAGFGDSQRVFLTTNNDGPETLPLVRMDDQIDAVNDVIAWGADLVLAVGDLIQDGDATAAQSNLCRDEEWLRYRNVMLGPRSTFSDGSACDGACACGQSGFTMVDFGDLTGMNTGSPGLLSVKRRTAFVAVRGNHDNGTLTHYSPTSTRSYETELGPAFNAREYGHYFLGAFPEPDGHGWSQAWLVPLGGRPTLVISYECAADQVAYDWALSLLRARRHLPGILIHHQGVGGGAADTDLLPGAVGVWSVGSDFAACGVTDVPIGVTLGTVAAQATNVRMTFGGHSFPVIMADAGEIATTTGGGGPVLHMNINWQGIWPAGGGSGGCYNRLTWANDEVDITTWGDEANGANCRTPVAAAEYDSWLDDLPLPFDPAACNGLMADRATIAGRASGCG